MLLILYDVLFGILLEHYVFWLYVVMCYAVGVNGRYRNKHLTSQLLYIR
jgi:hypothetical protein